jgi:hypothetical protein
MKKIILTLSLLASGVVTGQLRNWSGFKKNQHDLYEMQFTNPRAAIIKYNTVIDKLGADTSGFTYDIMVNPIDFGFFKKPAEARTMYISILLYEDEVYKIMFGEFDGTREKQFFNVLDENGTPIVLTYRPE